MEQAVKSEISRTHIIETALKEFSQYRYEEASMNRICREGNISKGKLYHYYEGKEQLYMSCVEYCYNCILRYIDSFSPDPGAELEENMQGFFSAWQSCWKENKDVMRFLIVYKVFFPRMTPVDKATREEFTENKIKPRIAAVLKPYFPDNPKRQQLLTNMTWLAIDYISKNIGVYGPNGIDADTVNDDEKLRVYFDEQAESFHRVLKVFLYGGLNI